MLGTVKSSNSFLFNARRTFDFQTQTIVLNELYVDPKGNGWGKYFYEKQLQTFFRFKKIILEESVFEKMW